MSHLVTPSSSDALVTIRAVIDGPLPGIAQRFSRSIAPLCRHTALIIYTRECTGRPRKVAGAPQIVTRATITELEALKQTTEPGTRFQGRAVVGAVPRHVWVSHDPSGMLLVLVVEHDVDPTCAFVVEAMFGLVATSIKQQVTQASPDFLSDSRAASNERARTIAELTAAHEANLLAVLGALRSGRYDDAHARSVATQITSSALIDVRAATENDRALAQENIFTAFVRLRHDLAVVLGERDIDLQCIEPTDRSETLPGEIAHAARAIVRTIVVALAAHPELSRLRIAWDRRDHALLIDVRDQQSTPLDNAFLAHELAGRVDPLGGTHTIETLPGWGNRIAVSLPLEPPPIHTVGDTMTTLSKRELQVLQHISAGRRNKTIAAELNLSQNTVKFHVSRVLRKLGATSRSEAAAIAARAGLGTA
ncbi:helix-turn-helix transcriptional regulator [Nocardia jejuensis]|uniref:helix-turn-helix transcriptional regulator n=1 Tax=Nocardia jejuensis TaxID=328049 RepID=UPI00082E4413|nr:LuxR C-terminal-related transcriptional regulator [Nocardia jejuensis]